MSYESEHSLPLGTRLADVREFVQLLGYKKTGVLPSATDGRFEDYYFSEEKDYKSWSGVELSIQIQDKSLTVSTRTTSGRSFFDLEHQNVTIARLKKRFGGTFRTDEGSGRYLRATSGPPPPPASGCHVAFAHFGHNLISTIFYLDSRNIKKQRGEELLARMGLSATVLSNNMAASFVVTSLEDYFKSTFVALLRYSPNKRSFFKSHMLKGDHLAAISDAKSSVEDQVAETMSFQNIAAVCRHFESLEPKLDLARPLRKPYRKRKQSFFELIEGIVSARHDFVHRAKLDLTLTDKRMYDVVYDLDVAITRLYTHIIEYFDWPEIERTWHLGNRRAVERFRKEVADSDTTTSRKVDP
jgi:hypothetical protein